MQTSGMCYYFNAYHQSFYSCLSSLRHKEVIKVLLKDTLFQGAPGIKPVTFRVACLITITHQTCSAILGSVMRIPQKPTGNYGSAHQLPREVIHQACIPNSNIQIYLGLLARPPDLRRHSNGLHDRAKTHSLRSPMSLSVFSQTSTHARTRTGLYKHTYKHANACAHTQYRDVIRPIAPHLLRQS